GKLLRYAEPVIGEIARVQAGQWMADAQVRVAGLRLRQRPGLRRPLRSRLESISSRANFRIFFHQISEQISWPHGLIFCVQTRHGDEKHAEADPADVRRHMTS